MMRMRDPNKLERRYKKKMEKKSVIYKKFKKKENPTYSVPTQDSRYKRPNHHHRVPLPFNLLRPLMIMIFLQALQSIYYFLLPL